MKYAITGTIFAAAIGFAPLASAQSHDFNHQSQQSVGMTAGFNLTMPLGQQRLGKVEDKARMGFRLGLTESYESRQRPTAQYRSVDVLEVGFRFDGTPNLLLSGQDIYTPLFTTLHADEEDTTSGGTKGGGSGTVLLIVGAVVVVGAVGAIATKEAVEDAFDFS